MFRCPQSMLTTIQRRINVARYTHIISTKSKISRDATDAGGDLDQIIATRINTRSLHTRFNNFDEM